MIKAPKTQPGDTYQISASGGPALEFLGNIPQASSNPHVFAGEKFGWPLYENNGSWRIILKRLT